MVNSENAQNPNDITIRSYNAEVAGYIQHTPATYQQHHTPLLHWINTTLSFIKNDDRILEIGSGFGRDARYIRTKGYNITCTDGASAFVDYLKAREWDAELLNVLTDDIPPSYKMVFANAVIPHFTPEQFEIVLSKIINTLPKDGVFAFSVKQGRGEEWITEKFEAKRFIHYWDPHFLKKCIERVGAEIVFWEEGIPGDLPSHMWINLTLRKQ